MKMTHLLLVYSLCVTFSFVLYTSPTFAEPVFVGLGDLPGGNFLSEAHAVSGDGATVVGTSLSASGIEAFRWTLGSGIVALGVPSASHGKSYAEDVSADGSVIVGWVSGSATAVKWEGSVMQDLGAIPGDWKATEAFGVSADGSVVVGRATIASGARSSEAFRWTADGGYIGLGDLPGERFESLAIGVSSDGSVIVGRGNTGDLSSWEPKATRWTQEDGIGDLGFLPDGRQFSRAVAVSPDGSTIIGTGDINGVSAAFKWTGIDGMTSIGQWSPGSISGGEPIIIGSREAEGGSEAVIWDESHGVRVLQDLLESEFGLILEGWTLEQATDISFDGTVIVGTGTNPLGQTEGWIVTIPEPSTVILIMAGSALICRRRKQVGSGVLRHA